MSDFVWARRREEHSSPNIAWSLCDGCRNLTVKKPEERLERLEALKPRGLAEETYRCEKRGENMDKKRVYEMTTEECPEHKTLKRRAR